jgi:hypothetical protein
LSSCRFLNSLPFLLQLSEFSTFFTSINCGPNLKMSPMTSACGIEIALTTDDRHIGHHSTGESPGIEARGGYWRVWQNHRLFHKEKIMHRSTALKTWALALAMAFAVSPMAWAAGSYQGTSSQQLQRRHQQTERPTMGTSGQHQSRAMTATVESVDKQKGSITLRPSNGKSVELQVPESMLSDLQSGDSVEVSIRKAGDDMQQGMGGRHQGMPGQSGSSRSNR